MLKSENELIESEEFKGFYHHPVHENIVVSKTGYVIELRSLSCPLSKISPWGYMTVNLRGIGTESVHRLLGEVFLADPHDIESPLINHKDGIKTNNDLNNLEWTDYSGNLVHAYVSGLRNDNRPMLLKDILTGKVERFYSLQGVARRFGVNGSFVHRYLVNNAMVPWMKRYELVYEGDDWRGLNGEDVGNVNNGQSKNVVVIKDGKKFIFGSISDVHRTFDITKFKLYAALAKRSTIDGVEIHYLDEYEGDTSDAERPTPHKSTIDRPNFKRKPVPIRTTDVVTGEILDWDSTEELAKVYSITKSAIQRSVLLNGGRWRHFQIEYMKQPRSAVSEMVQ